MTRSIPENALIDPALVQPRAVLPVQALDVLEIAVAQGFQQSAHVNGFAVLLAMNRGPEEFQQAAMLGAVREQAWEPALFHQLFLAPEMHARELDQPVCELGNLLAAGAAHHGLANLIDGVHEDAVLVVHGADADATGVVPG